MSDFSVQTKALNSGSDAFKGVSRDVQSIAEDARRILSQTRNTITIRLAQSNKSGAVYSSISNCSRDLTNLSSALNKISSIYNRYEQNIASKDISDSFENAHNISAALEGITGGVGGNGAENNWFDKYLEILGIPSWIGDLLEGITNDIQGLSQFDFIKKIIDGIKGSSTAIPIIGLFLSAPNFANSVLELYKEIKNGGGFWDELLSVVSSGGKFTGSAAQVWTIGTEAAKKLAPAMVYLNIALAGIDFISEGIETYDKVSADGKVDMNDIAEMGIRSSIKGLDSLFCFGLLDEDKVSEFIMNWAKNKGNEIGNHMVEAYKLGTDIGTTILSLRELFK